MEIEAVIRLLFYCSQTPLARRGIIISLRSGTSFLMLSHATQPLAKKAVVRDGSMLIRMKETWGNSHDQQLTENPSAFRKDPPLTHSPSPPRTFPAPGSSGKPSSHRPICTTLCIANTALRSPLPLGRRQFLAPVWCVERYTNQHRSHEDPSVGPPNS